MKQYLFLLVVGIINLSCSSTTNDDVPNFIPGTYAREVSNEMSAGRDTLRISQISGGSYAIRRNGVYRRIKDGVLLQPECKTETWTAVYDEQTGVLNESKRGRTLSFLSQKGLLLVGGSMYKKVNP